jgi:hypothetical protein
VHALEDVGWRRIVQLACLGIAQRRRQAFIAIRHRPLHAINRIAGDGVGLAQLVDQRRHIRFSPSFPVLPMVCGTVAPWGRPRCQPPRCRRQIPFQFVMAEHLLSLPFFSRRRSHFAKAPQIEQFELNLREPFREHGI